MDQKLSRPLLRYHGGKWILAPWIISHFPEHRTYVDPFGGAASVLLRKPRSRSEVYNDLDGDVVNFFRVARERGPELIRALELTPYALTEYRAALKPSHDPFESARRLVVRSFMGFGSDTIRMGRTSGFRTTRSHNSTTPASDWRNYPEHLAEAIERLRGVVIENREAKFVMSLYDGPETLHYCDPPYVKSTRSGKDGAHRRRYTHEMSDADHVDLALFLRSLTGMVFVSGYDSSLYRELYDGWPIFKKRVLADGARPRTECLWLSPNIKSMNLFEERISKS